MSVFRWILPIACLAYPLCLSSLTVAEPATSGTPTNSKVEFKPNKAALEAMLSKCSEEADAKGLFVRKGKGAERKAFRRECMRKMGVEPH